MWDKRSTFLAKFFNIFITQRKKKKKEIWMGKKDKQNNKNGKTKAKKFHNRQTKRQLKKDIFKQSNDEG
jgi:hypothetical protein